MRIAAMSSTNLKMLFDRLRATKLLRSSYLPVYGMGSSLGCKLHLLIGSVFDVEGRQYSDLFQQLCGIRSNTGSVSGMPSVFKVEFTPSPQDTNRLVQDSYQIRRNLLVKFNGDNISQTLLLTNLLKQRFADMITVQTLAGNHQTPFGQSVAGI